MRIAYRSAMTCASPFGIPSCGEEAPYTTPFVSLPESAGLPYSDDLLFSIQCPRIPSGLSGCARPALADRVPYED
jgi:hypothetical protein